MTEPTAPPSSTDEPGASTSTAPSQNADDPSSIASRTVPGTTLLRAVGHALWIGPLVTTVLLSAFILVAAAADNDLGFESAASQVAVVAMVVFFALPVSLGCSAAAGLVAGAAVWPLRGHRVPLWLQALLGGLAATVVVGTALVLMWSLVRTVVVLAVVVALACLITGALAVLVAGRVHDADVATDLPSAERRTSPSWVPVVSALSLTGVLVGIGFWWFHQLVGFDGPDPMVDVPAVAVPPAPGPDDVVSPSTMPPPMPPPSEPTPVPAPPTSVTQARPELDDLRLQALTAGGDGLLWSQPLAVAEEHCWDDAGNEGTALTLYGRFTTRDLATATDNVDFLSITQDNERVAARIVDAWTGGHRDTAETLKGEYWLTPAGTVAVREAHVGFDQGVGKVRVTTMCAVPA